MKLFRFFIFLSILLSSTVSAQGDNWQYIFSPGELTTFHSYISGIKNCTKCHDIPRGISEEKCLDCHREIRERKGPLRGHHGTLSQDCFQCHTEHQKNIIKNFDHEKFDHSKSLFMLSGKHAHTECGKCHLKEEKISGLKRFTYLGISIECIGCHNNIHRTPDMEKCGHCHSQADWQKTSFNHDQSSYKLKGAHTKVRCNACHEQGKYKGIKHDNCIVCHRDEHNGQFQDRRCEACHVVEDFKRLTFDHEKADFKLGQLHSKVRCESCHRENLYRSAPIACESCHKDIAEFYKGVSGNNSQPLPSPKSAIVGCDKCHETDIKDFKVDGAKCLSCHGRFYDDFFNSWDGFLKMDISGISWKMNRMLDCMTISLNDQKKIKDIMDRLSFLEKNLHHNYRLTARVINEYVEFLEGTDREGCSD